MLPWQIFLPGHGVAGLAFYWASLLFYDAGYESVAAKKLDAMPSILGRENISLVLSKLILTGHKSKHKENV